MLGRAGLHYPEGWPEPEVNWALGRPYWGRGFAFEAVKAVLAHAFNTLNWERAMSLIAPQNHRSIRLAQRLGERFERDGSARLSRRSLLDRPSVLAFCLTQRVKLTGALGAGQDSR